MNNCVIYARFSSYGQNEQSIEAQVRTCKEYADNKGIKTINIYTDKAKTGTNDARPAFQRMIKDAQSGAFQFIIVYMFDRFARNRRDSIMYKELLKEKYGIRVVSALEPIAEDEGGEFYEMFLEWNAEKYSKRLSKRVKDGIDINVANGTFCGGHLLYGYTIILQPIDGKPDKFIKRISVNNEEAPIIRFIFESYDKGISKKEIACELNRRGCRINDKPFTYKTFDKWLLNPKYTGEFYFGGRLCKNMYPAIIDKDLFLRVQKRVAENKYVSGGMATANVPYLLTGKLFCGHCGTKMIADGGTSRSGTKYYYYSCKKMKKHECRKRRENKDALEFYVTSCVVDFLSNKDNVDVIVTDVFNYYEKRTDEKNLKSIQKKIANVKKYVNELADAFVKAKSKLLQETIEKKMSEYEIMLNNLSEQQAKLELERGYRFTKQDLFDFINELLKGDKHDKDYQRQIIDNLVSQIYITDNETIVYFNIKGGNNSIKKISFCDNNAVLNKDSSVQSQLLPCQKNSTSFDLSNFFIQAAGLAYHRRTKRGVYHQPLRGCISSRASVYLPAA